MLLQQECDRQQLELEEGSCGRWGSSATPLCVACHA